MEPEERISEIGKELKEIKNRVEKRLEEIYRHNRKVAG